MKKLLLTGILGMLLLNCDNQQHTQTTVKSIKKEIVVPKKQIIIPIKEEHEISDNPTEEAEMFFRSFPTTLSGAQKVIKHDKDDKTIDAYQCIIYIRQKHLKYQYGVDTKKDYETVDLIQKDIYNILGALTELDFSELDVRYVRIEGFAVQGYRGKISYSDVEKDLDKTLKSLNDNFLTRSKETGYQYAFGGYFKYANDTYQILILPGDDYNCLKDAYRAVEKGVNRNGNKLSKQQIQEYVGIKRDRGALGLIITSDEPVSVLIQGAYHKFKRTIDEYNSKGVLRKRLIEIIPEHLDMEEVKREGRLFR